MTETAASGSDRPAKKSSNPRERKLGFFARIALFIRQVIAELRKVVTPTRPELINFTIVVLVFVIMMMAITAVLDLAFGWGIGVIFGSTGFTES
ncbi:preprotein translocase subunit SecE [Acaricomes phytoseiuli]|uniref:preprotein translocase subunit SecE n=1 Tax=Acaricomes phytoseiuli TaxID=291968 RepID=UPI002221B18E|nr:preprotein translocase subunit SecE [Acaricomes phytoseiuli]MCW1249756.1 preprotein translocase subunit SecE [Acaricomes phytoseiuli]